MNFSLPGFWLSLFVGLSLLALLSRLGRWWGGRNFDRELLALLSLTLLGLERWLTLGVFLFVFGVTYGALFTGLRSRMALTLVLLLQLGPLVFYKYTPFVTGQVFGESPDVLRDLLIPVGLSFYTLDCVRAFYEVDLGGEFGGGVSGD